MTDIPTRSTIGASSVPEGPTTPPVLFVTVLTASYRDEDAVVLGVYRATGLTPHAPEAIKAAKVLRDTSLNVHMETVRFGTPTEEAITAAGRAAFKAAT